VFLKVKIKFRVIFIGFEEKGKVIQI